MKIQSSVLVAAMIVSHSALGALGDCRLSAPRNAEVDAAGAIEVVIHARAGELTVRGVQAAARVKAQGNACSDSQNRLDAMRIDTRRDGDTIHLETVLPDSDSFLNSDKIDLTVELPATLAVTLSDSSGDLSVTGVASLELEDSSGDQSIRDIAGDVTVADSSGEIDIKSVRGSVTLSDSSGEIIVADVGGDVLVKVDSSGDLELRRIHGSVRVRNDSSGDIEISDVNQDVTIDHDSSGDVRVADVGGRFTVARDSSGTIDHRNVLGAVSIPPSKRERD